MRKAVAEHQGAGADRRRTAAPSVMQSLIRDPELIRQKYGMESHKASLLRYFQIHGRHVTDEEARPVAEQIIAGATDVKVNTDWFLNDIKYYLAAKKMMDVYQCNAFSTACHELCTSEIPQNRKFTPCICHSLLKGGRDPQRVRGGPERPAGHDDPAVYGLPARVHGKSQHGVGGGAPSPSCRARALHERLRQQTAHLQALGLYRAGLRRKAAGGLYGKRGG